MMLFRAHVTITRMNGALMFSPPTFGPSDNSTHTFSPRETGSQKLLVQVTFVPQCGPTVRPPPKGMQKSWTNCSSTCQIHPWLWRTQFFDNWTNILKWPIKITTTQGSLLDSNPWSSHQESSILPLRYNDFQISCQILDKTLFWYLISVISDIGLSLISESPISDWESEVRHYIRYRNKVLSLSNIRHPALLKRGVIAEWYRAWLWFKGHGFESYWCPRNFCKCQISEWTLMSILEHPPMKITIFRCKYMHTAEEKKFAKSWNIHILQQNNGHILWHFVYFPGKKGNAFRNVQANCDTWTPKWTKNSVDPMSHTRPIEVDWRSLWHLVHPPYGGGPKVFGLIITGSKK